MSATDPLNVSTYGTAAMAVLVMYDHTITLSTEVSHVWGGKRSICKVLFVVNRYAALAKVILMVVGVWMTSVHPCDLVHRCFIAFDLTSGFTVAAFSVVRVWMLWERRWWPALVVLPFSLVIPCATTYRSALSSMGPQLSPLPLPFAGCSTRANIDTVMYYHLSEAARGCAVVNDVLVLVFTWIKTFDTYKLAKEVGIRSGMAELLLRDGTVYFAILLICNILQLAFNATSFAGGIAVLLLCMNNLFPTILTSRFLLDLLEAVHCPNGVKSTNMTRTGVQFAASILGHGPEHGPVRARIDDRLSASRDINLDSYRPSPDQHAEESSNGEFTIREDPRIETCLA